MHTGGNLSACFGVESVGFALRPKLPVAASAGVISIVDLPADFAVFEYTFTNAHIYPLKIQVRLPAGRRYLRE